MLRRRTFWTLPYTFANIFNFLRRPNCPRFATWLGLQSRSCIPKISDPPHNCVPIMNGFMTSNFKVNAKQSLNNSDRLNCSWKGVHWQKHDDILATGDPCLLNLKKLQKQINSLLQQCHSWFITEQKFSGYSGALCLFTFFKFFF